MDNRSRSYVQKADKCARGKAYPCLAPECTKEAIRSHAIQKASLTNALAVDGQVYTLRQSFNMFMGMTHPGGPLDVVPVGVSEASTFKGFCAHHDGWMFMPAELPP